MKNAFDWGQSMFFPSFLQSAAASFLQEAWLSKLSRRRHCFKHSGWLALIMTWRKVLIDIHSCIKGGGKELVNPTKYLFAPNVGHGKRGKINHFIFFLWFRNQRVLWTFLKIYLVMMEHQIIDYWIWMRHLKLMDGSFEKFKSVVHC